MSFLIAEIVGLLLLAASFGAALTWWWLKRGLEDVTEQYEALERLASADPSKVLGARFDALEKLVSTRSEPAPAPAVAATAVDGVAIDFAPILARLEALERALASAAPLAVDLGAVQARLEALAAAVDALGRRLAIPEPPPTSLPTAPPTSPPTAPPTAPMAVHFVTEGRNLLKQAAFGPPDDILVIKGIGPKLNDLLHKIGVFYFWQIAAWTESDVAYIDGLLDSFQGRIEREEWLQQAKELQQQPTSAKPPA